AVTINLCASDGQITMPDGVVVPVLGFVQTATCGPNLVNDTNFPGAPLVVNELDTVTVNVTNSLPAGTLPHALRFEIPGIAFDPAVNAPPDTFDLHAYRATYWLINGKAYPQTAPVAATAGQRVLLRYVNGGFDNTTMLLLGMHERVLARDARLLNNAFDADA